MIRLSRSFRHLHTAAKTTGKITRNDLPVCSQCKFFYMGDNTCGKFGEKDILKGGIHYDSARSCRQDETQCGTGAVLYSPMTRGEKITKQVYYYLSDAVYMLVPTLAFTGALLVYSYFGLAHTHNTR